MSKLVYPSIPEPTPTFDSLFDTVRALKMSVETLAGQRAGGAPNRVYVQDDAPTALATGDVWIAPGDALGASLVRYWNGTSWLRVSV